MKNCLAVIGAIASLCEHELSSRGRERMARLKDAATRLGGLLEEDLSQPPDEALSATPPTAPCCTTSIAKLVESVMDRATDQAERGGVQIFAQSAGGEIDGDAEALGEALFNLVTNAIAATPEGGGVFVATYITREGDQRWVVRDTGVGMEPEHLAELGRRLRCSRREGGTGLGFALAQAAIVRHGGVLHVESAPNRGTTMSCWLPRRAGSLGGT